MLIKCPNANLQVSDKATILSPLWLSHEPEVKPGSPVTKITNGDGSLTDSDRSVK